MLTLITFNIVTVILARQVLTLPIEDSLGSTTSSSTTINYSSSTTSSSTTSNNTDTSISNTAEVYQSLPAHKNRKYYQKMSTTTIDERVYPEHNNHTETVKYKLNTYVPRTRCCRGPSPPNTIGKRMWKKDNVRIYHNNNYQNVNNNYNKIITDVKNTDNIGKSEFVETKAISKLNRNYYYSVFDKSSSDLVTHQSESEMDYGFTRYQGLITETKINPILPTIFLIITCVSFVLCITCCGMACKSLCEDDDDDDDTEQYY